MNTADIDTTNMCSHLRHKLMDNDGIYHHLWQQINGDQELTAVVRSRQLHIYRNGKKVLVLKGKAKPQIVREDALCYLLKNKEQCPWNQADALAHRNELNKQVGDMLDRVLPEEERELLRLYFGIGRRRHSMDELIALFDGERKVNTLLQSALERLRYSEEILAIYKYLHK